MVSKLTIFEPHFEGASFGGSTEDESVPESSETESETAGGRSLLRAAMLIVAAVGVALAVRRVRNGSSDITLEPAEAVEAVAGE